MWPAHRRARIRFALLAVAAALSATPTAAQDAASEPPREGRVIVCQADAGRRQRCEADTSAGVALLTALQGTTCERDRSWGTDEAGIWVADGCHGAFLVAAPPRPPVGELGPTGFRIVDTPQGDVNLKLFTYVRYLDQRGIDETYTDASGTTRPVRARQDIHFQKVFLQFVGWIGNPRLRYLAYVWTANVSQGLPAQVVVGGNLQYRVSDHLTLGGGIGGLPGTRSVEGNFPNWLTVDNRLLADEFFRPSYTQGVWGKGRIVRGLEYFAMLGNNLSQLGVDAGQLGNGLNTVSASLMWMPTTGEFGVGLGDYEQHERVATRLALHATRSDENRQSQPDTEAIENTQIRLSDGSIIFTPGLFGEQTTITDARYRMLAVDGGIKYRGFALEAEYYWRRVDRLRGRGIEMLAFDQLRDHGFQVQASAMVLPRQLQVYASGSRIAGEYGTPWDLRAGVTLFPWKTPVARWHNGLIHVRRSPVGALSLPLVVGASGPVFHSDFVISF
ncbi:hypothetical protein TBR22_A03700 [Luteitalea sp. TBR-22]|uniref:DUF3011 domain-containing protein n=1 Tax=Luteitalea sp. TBR-22 TaxID=2802971 RepID=UPI001AF84A5E|nr:DUF3011 domain-containing protein [Luteitalea sp. TBR-22]BCS31170.1 hypothetical protein TBR22_A03700 [Luteitalea sp. TBR-22]